jgi:hypothetical protein
VVVDHVEQNRDAGLVGLAHQSLQPGDASIGARGAERQARVIAPRHVALKSGHGKQLDRGDPERAQVGQPVDNVVEGPHRLSALRSKAADVQLVDDELAELGGVPCLRAPVERLRLVDDGGHGVTAGSAVHGSSGAGINPGQLPARRGQEVPVGDAGAGLSDVGRPDPVRLGRQRLDGRVSLAEANLDLYRGGVGSPDAKRRPSVVRDRSHAGPIRWHSRPQARSPLLSLCRQARYPQTHRVHDFPNREYPTASPSRPFLGCANEGRVMTGVGSVAGPLLLVAATFSRL